LTENITMRSLKRWFSRAETISTPKTDAFAILYEKTYLSVFRYVYGLSGGSQQDAEDLTAGTYIRALKAYQRFDGSDQAALGWLLHIAKNLVIDLARRQKVQNMNEAIDIELLVGPGQLPELDFIAREQITTLWHLLGTLPETTREILVLRYMLGWQVKQVAEYVGMSETNVSVTIHRALHQLQLDWPHAQEKDNE